MTRYAGREYGQDFQIFKQSPALGKAMHLGKLGRPSQAPWDNDIALLFSRVSNKHNKHPSLHDFLHVCLVDLVNQLS